MVVCAPPHCAATIKWEIPTRTRDLDYDEKNNIYDGKVLARHTLSIGASAVGKAGTMLAEIIPAEARYLVQALILPLDVAQMQMGQVVRISLAAYDPPRYGW